jgi:hypothetical protein
MDPKTCLAAIIRPTLAFLGPPYAGEPAEVMLLAIALQESGLATREQMGGPAHGLWQFELATATNDFVVAGRTFFKNIVESLGFKLNPFTLWDAIAAGADQLACVLARERLYRMVDAPLPAVGDQGEAWRQYVQAWGPGRPSEGRWAVCYPEAVAALHG